MKHECPGCKFFSIDNETLLVCPACASNEITNIPEDADPSDFDDWDDDRNDCTLAPEDEA